MKYLYGRTLLHMPYSTVSFRMTVSDLEWLSKICNDKKRRAVSLRQLSFLLITCNWYVTFKISDPLLHFHIAQLNYVGLFTATLQHRVW